MARYDRFITQTPGLYIVVEGPDGCGKTTFCQTLKRRYEALYPNKPITVTREPGSLESEVCLRIRELLKQTKIEDPLTEYFLFTADRNEHLRTVVEPRFNRGEIIISDRSIVTTLINQAGSKIQTPYSSYYRRQNQTLNNDIILHKMYLDLGFLRPSEIVYIDTPPEILFERLSKRQSDEVDVSRHNKTSLEYLTDLYQKYNRVIDMLSRQKGLFKITRLPYDVLDTYTPMTFR